MKKIFLLALLISFFTAAFTQHKKFTVKVSNFQFQPKIVNAKLLDTIVFVWVNGTHTATSTSVPAGANTFNKPINVTHKRFKYALKKTGTYKYRCNIHPTQMTGTINVTSATLTSDLSSFDIDDASANAVLNWNTSSSQDVSYFSVQRSIDGDNFTEIARVQPDLSNQYKFTDNNSTSSKYVYYQVELIDAKGNSELSEIRMFTQKASANKLVTSISPNPVSNHIMLQFNADEEGTMSVQLYNQSGAFITRTQMAAFKGLNNGHFHLGDLSPGTYYIVCTLGRTTEKHTIIVK